MQYNQQIQKERGREREWVSERASEREIQKPSNNQHNHCMAFHTQLDHKAQWQNHILRAYEVSRVGPSNSKRMMWEDTPKEKVFFLTLPDSLTDTTRSTSVLLDIMGRTDVIGEGRRVPSNNAWHEGPYKSLTASSFYPGSIWVPKQLTEQRRNVE